MQFMIYALIRNNVNVDARPSPAEEQSCRPTKKRSMFGDCLRETKTSRACTLGILRLSGYPDIQNTGI